MGKRGAAPNPSCSAAVSLGGEGFLGEKALSKFDAAKKTG